MHVQNFTLKQRHDVFLKYVVHTRLDIYDFSRHLSLDIQSIIHCQHGYYVT